MNLWSESVWVRYSRAQAILFGNDMDIQNRFNVNSDEWGQVLLRKIFDVYQDVFEMCGQCCVVGALRYVPCTYSYKLSTVM